MRIRTITAIAVAIGLCGIWSLPSAADPPPVAKEKTSAKATEKPIDWKDDPVCQMVFFAILEGLYSDGVPSEVVDSIVPPKKEGDASVKNSFVIECPLCHPTYEAFRLYQQRKPFASDLKRDSFGKGLDAKLVENLKSPVTMTRLKALQELVRSWVDRRLTMMRLTTDEKKEWTTKIGERSRQGKGELSKRLDADPDYKGWSMYWGCAACNGSERGCSAAQASGK